jgi:hypothetical protein
VSIPERAAPFSLDLPVVIEYPTGLDPAALPRHGVTAATAVRGMAICESLFWVVQQLGLMAGDDVRVYDVDDLFEALDCLGAVGKAVAAGASDQAQYLEHAAERLTRAGGVTAMTRRNEVPPAALRVPTAAEEEEGQQRAEAIATLLESNYRPRHLSDLLEDHVIRLSEQTHLYIFAPEVVRAMYPLMYRRAVKMAIAEEEEQERERRRRRREKRASKAAAEAPPEETDSVN